MDKDPDLQMAMLLQSQFNLENNILSPPSNLTYNAKNRKNNPKDPQKSLIDPSWELVDPTPNIHILFVQFSKRFFWDKLQAVTVSWSKRMTTCAGICSYQGRGGLCRITLSEPLLKLRPRKDMIETLLHEMIHAYLFVSHNNRDRDGHGPEFHKHMHRINKETGTNITVYHSFHDEVRLYKQHWWRCNGPCQHRPPFFGMVRRAINRAPGPYDRWWAQHQQTCGGSFIKVKEPDKTEKNNKKPGSSNINSYKKTVSPSKSQNIPDIRQFFPSLSPKKGGSTTLVPSSKVPLSGNFNKGLSKNVAGFLDQKSSNGNGTKVLSATGSNVTGFSELKSSVQESIKPFSGTGHLLKSPTSSSRPSSGVSDYSDVRNHWANKFSDSKPNLGAKRKILTPSAGSKRTKVESDRVNCPNCNGSIIERDLNSHLDTCLSADDSIKSEFSNDSLQFLVECPVCRTPVQEEEMNNHLDECVADVDAKVQSIVKKEGEASTSTKTHELNDVKNDGAKKCGICAKPIPLSKYNSHVEDCLNKYYNDIEKKYGLNPTGSNSEIVEEIREESVVCLVCNKKVVKADLNAHLEECMVQVFDDNDDDITQFDSNDNNEEVSGKYNCPICMELINESNMNSHIDECLNLAAMSGKI